MPKTLDVQVIDLDAKTTRGSETQLSPFEMPLMRLGSSRGIKKDAVSLLGALTLHL